MSRYKTANRFKNTEINIIYKHCKLHEILHSNIWEKSVPISSVLKLAAIVFDNYGFENFVINV